MPPTCSHLVLERERLVNKLKQAVIRASRIAASGLSIYDSIEVGSDLWLPSDLLEALLQTRLAGHCFEAVALRTRSKLAKSEVCKAMGYPVPKSFRKLKGLGRFPGQNLDTYVQTAATSRFGMRRFHPHGATC